MSVLMMHVRHVLVGMLQSHMRMPMGVGLTWRIFGFVDVLMILIMNVRMRVYQRFVDMLVFVMLGQMQPHSDRHECSRDDELGRNRFTG